MFIQFVQTVSPILLFICKAASTPIERVDIVTEGGTQRIQGAPITLVRAFAKVGRNEPCSCGSSKKMKHCCGA